MVDRIDIAVPSKTPLYYGSYPDSDGITTEKDLQVTIHFSEQRLERSSVIFQLEINGERFYKPIPDERIDLVSQLFDQVHRKRILTPREEMEFQARVETILFNGIDIGK